LKNSHKQGLDFADALHLASSKARVKLVTFDDKGFVRRANRLALKPEVTMAKNSTS
jgi:predicted nucleic acid-binding protein